MSKGRTVPKEEGELAGTTLKIPVADWIEQYTQEEADLSTLEKAIDLQVKKGIPPATMGILCLIGGLRGEVPEEVTLFPKTSLLVGLSQTVSQRLSIQKERYKAPSGRTFLVRKYIAEVPVRPGGDGQDDGEGEMAVEVEIVMAPGYNYAEVGTQKALDEAEKYLLRRVTGHIFNRLAIIAASGGDVEAIADMLKGKVDDMVDRLIEPADMEPCRG